jgi:hypothetical protein
MTTFTDPELLAAEAKVRHDRAEIGRALTGLKSGARDTAKPVLEFATGMIGLYVAIRLAHRWL